MESKRITIIETISSSLRNFTQFLVEVFLNFQISVVTMKTTKAIRVTIVVMLLPLSATTATEMEIEVETAMTL